MAVRDELSKRCILLKSVNEVIELDDIRNSLSTLGENWKQFYRYVEECENDVRWIVLLESEKGALKCIQANKLAIKTDGNKVFNVDVGYCPECIIPMEWIEEESKKLNYTFAAEDHQTMDMSISDREIIMGVDDSLTENNAAYQELHFEDSENNYITQLYSTEADQSDNCPDLDFERKMQTVSHGIPNCISDNKKNYKPGMIEEDFRTSLQGFTVVDQNKEEIDNKGNNSYFKLEVFRKGGNEFNDRIDIMDKKSHTNMNQKDVNTTNSVDEDLISTEDESNSFEPQKDKEDKESSSLEESYFNDQDISGFECEDFPTSVHCIDESFASNVGEISGKYKLKIAGTSAMMNDGLENELKIMGKSDMMGSSIGKSLGPNINDSPESEPKNMGKSDLNESSMGKSLGPNISDSPESEPKNMGKSDMMGSSMEKSLGPNISDSPESEPKNMGKSDMMESSVEKSLGPNISDSSESEQDILGKSDMMESSIERSPNRNYESESEVSLKFSLQIQDKVVHEKYNTDDQKKYIPSYSLPKTHVEYGLNSDRQNSMLTNENLAAEMEPNVEQKSDDGGGGGGEDNNVNNDGESQSDTFETPHTSDPSLHQVNIPSFTSKSNNSLSDLSNVTVNDFKSEESLQVFSEPNFEKMENAIERNNIAENIDTKLEENSNKLLETDLKMDPHESQWHAQPNRVRENPQNQIIKDEQVVIAEGQKNEQQFPQYPIPMMPGYPAYGQRFIRQKMDISQGRWFYPHPVWHKTWPHNPTYPTGPMQMNPEQPNAAVAQPVMNPLYYNPQQGYCMPAKFPLENYNYPHVASSKNLEKQQVSKSVEKLENSTEADDRKDIHSNSERKAYSSSAVSTHGFDEDRSQKVIDISDRKKQKFQKSEKRHKKDTSIEDFDQDFQKKESTNLKDKKEKLHNDDKKYSRDVRPKIDTTSSSHSESDNEDVCCGINVILSSSVTQELLENYFENTRRSGGDEIKCVNYNTDKDQVYIEFYDHKAVDRIIEKGTEHRVSGVTLFISKYPQEKVSPKVMDDYKVLIKGLNPSTNQECLFDFLEVKCGIEATDILYGEDSDTVLVMFDDKPDISKLKKLCKKKPLDGHYLEVYRVPLSRKIRVSNINESFTEDEIRYYFENRKKSDGGDVANIEIHQELGICIVTFRRPEVVERICSRRHKLQNQKLDVQKFHICLGLMGGKESRKSVELPPPITRSGIDSNIIEFLYKSQSHKRSLEEELLKHHAKVEWPCDQNADTLTFICLLNLNDPKASQIVKSWEKSVHNIIDKFLNVITSVHISVVKETWESVMDSLKNINIEHPEGVIVIIKKEDCTIVLVGHKSIVKTLHQQIKNIMSLEESKLQEQHENVTITQKLKTYQIQILYRKKFGSLVKDVEVKVDLNKKQVVFCGRLENIECLKLQMYETLQQFVSKKMQISTGMKKLLVKKEISKFLNDKMQAKKIKGFWDINSSNNSLDMYAESISEVDDAIEVVKACILEKSVPMQGMLGKFLSAPRWKKTLISLEAIHQGLACIEGDRDSVIVTGPTYIFTEIFKKVKQEANDYIQINSVTIDTIFDEEGKFQYIEKYQSNRKQEIVRPLVPKYQITVSTISGPSSFGYSVKGHIDGVEIVKRGLKELMSSVQLEKFPFPKTGAKEFFLSSKGHECIRQAETISRCIIKISGKQKRGKKNDLKAREDLKRGGNERYQSEPGLVALCHHDEKRIIKIVEGDMTKLKVDAIVNAANKDMSHGGGIAAAIVKAGGQAIQDECYNYVKNHGQLPEGNAIFSQPGKLPCKLIIHTVGPTWEDGKRNEESLLKSAVIKSLQLASSKTMSSIAFPAISSGIFGYPLDLSTRAIVEAINDYLSNEWKNSTILEVYLCDIDQKTISSFIKALEKEYGASDVKMIENTDNPGLMREISYSCSESEDSKDGDSGSDSDSDQSYHSDHDENSEMDNTDDKGATGGTNLSYPSSNAHCSKENSSSKSHDQQGDKSSRSSDHGDRSLKSYDQSNSSGSSNQQRDRSSKMGNSENFQKPVSQMFSTPMIKVKKEELSRHKAEVVVNSAQSDLDLNAGILSRSLLIAAGNSLQVECRQRYPNGIKYGQIAVTKGGNLSCSYVYHGTLKKWDNGKGDALQTMESLVESCLELANKHNVTSIGFPALGTGKLGYPAYIAANTMFQCIDKYLTQNKTTSIRQVNIVIYPKDVGTLKAFESAEEVYNSNSYSQHERKTMKYPHSSTASSSEHGSHLQEPPQTKIGHLMVSIVIGDITKEVSHVIVNSTMDPRDLSKGAVSKAILKAAGSQIQDECLQKGKFFTSDKPLVTSGGYMNCRVIFHVKSQKEADEWEKVVSMCLFEAERRRFSSISFPALGTGGLGCSPDDVAKAMFKAIRNFSPEPQHLKHIRIVVFQENMMDRFIAGLDKKESEGIFAKVKVAAGKVKDKIAQGIKSLTEDDPKPVSKVIKSQRSKPKKVESISFLIYSDSRDNIKKAKKKLEDSYNNEFSEKTLSGVYKDAITNLTEKQKAEIEKICQKYHVTVKTNRQKGLIELCGRKNNVADAHSSISDYIHGEDKKKDTYDKGKAISKYVQWYYEDNNKKMKMFSPNMNYELEIAHSRKEQKCYVKDNKGASYMVDFKKMEETVLSQPGIKLKVERRETNSGAKSEKLPLPKTWLPMKQDENLKVITLQPGDREYEKVKSEFTKSAQAHRNVIKINRIQNKFLYQQYAAKRAELKLKNQGKNPERWLWHGTSPDTLTKINHNGFNRSYCGKNGTMYGQGVYFAVNASYSLRYCVADGKGQYHMYAVQVLTGDCCQGSSSMRFLPPKGLGSASHITYDSATDNPGNPNMFIIFHDSQAYPTYHIVFK